MPSAPAKDNKLPALKSKDKDKKTPSKTAEKKPASGSDKKKPGSLDKKAPSRPK